jgi:hypothetical protein
VFLKKSVREARKSVKSEIIIFISELLNFSRPLKITLLVQRNNRMVRMFFRLAADAVVVIHLLFIVFALFGGLLVLRWHWLLVLHLPAVVWGAVVEFFHLYCPLTPLENALRERAGIQGYDSGFIEHYLIPLIYPAGLTPQIQLWLGGGVVLCNLAVYSWLASRGLQRRKSM